MTTVRPYLGATLVKAGTRVPVQWWHSYEAPFEVSIYPGGGAFLTVSVIVYGVNEISAFDAMTHFYFDGVSIGCVIGAGWHVWMGIGRMMREGKQAGNPSFANRRWEGRRRLSRTHGSPVCPGMGVSRR